MGILCGLAGLVFLLVVVAVIGHVLWLMGEAAVQGLRKPAAEKRCPACTGRLEAWHVRCPACGIEVGPAKSGTLEQELAATWRQLQRLLAAGRISAVTCNEIYTAIQVDARERDQEAALNLVKLKPADLQPLEATEVIEPEAASPAALPSSERTLPAPVPTPTPTFVGVPIAAASRVEPSASITAAPEPETDEPRGLAGILQAFMEEKNIRWGELISGLLIVGSSVGLVISLWATLKEKVPYFPVAVFLLATAAIHAAGLYTLKRWHLKSTSRGLLLVSTLLVPLNVLAAMVLNEKKPVYEEIDYVAFAIGLSLLAAIAFSAARVLNRYNPWPMVAALVGTAIGMSTIGRLAGQGAEMWQTIGLFGLPCLSFLAGAVAHVVDLSAGRRLSVRRVAQSFRFYGIAAFGLILAAGLLASKCGDILGTLSLLSPMLTAVAATIAGAGLVVHQRITAPSQAGFRMAGTSVALGGGFLATAALILAWPRPDLLIAVGLLDAFAFGLLAWFAAFPALSVFATASFSLAFLIGFEWGAGEISIVSATTQQLSHLLLTTQSALILAFLSLAADGVGCLLVRFKARPHAAAYFTSAVVHEAVSVAIAVAAVWTHAPDQHLATAVFALAAVRWLVAMWWIKRDYASVVAAVLLFAALGHGLGMNDRLGQMLATNGLRPADPWKMSFLLHATICLAYAAFARFALPTAELGQRKKNLILPLAGAAIVTSALSLPMTVFVANERFFAHAGYAFWTAAIWFGAAVLQGTAVLAIAAQIFATVGVVFAVTGYCRDQAWWTGRFTDPRFLNWQFGALAAWSVLWIAVRRVGGRVPYLARVLTRDPTSVDRVALGGAVGGLVGSCFVATLPGIISELAAVNAIRAPGRPFCALVLIPFGVAAVLSTARALFSRRWQEGAAIAIGVIVVSAALLIAPRYAPGRIWPGFPTPYGQGWGAGAWAALGLALLAVLAAHWERPGRVSLVGIALLLSAVPFLIACRWDGELRTASALRWASAIGALAVAGLWSWYRPLERFARQFSGGSLVFPARAAVNVRNILVATMTMPVLMLTSQALVAIVGEGRIAAAPITASLFFRMGPYASYAVPVAILAAAFIVYAIADRRVLWGMAATFLIQFALGLMASLSLVFTQQSQTLTEIVRYLQEMGLSAAIAAVVWFGIEPFVLRRSAASEHDLAVTPAGTQLGFVAVFVSLLAVGATAGLWYSPEPLLNSVRECGAPLGWLFLLLATAVWCWQRRSDWPCSAIALGLLFLTAAAPQGAGTLARWNSADNWLSFHTALGIWCGVIGLAALVVATTRSIKQRATALAIANGTLVLLPMIVLFAFKAEWGDPLRPWWAAGAMIWLSVCVTVMAVGAESRLGAYLSLAFAALGVTFIGLRPWLGMGYPMGSHPMVDLIHTIILGTMLHGIAWLAIELTHQRKQQLVFDATSNLPPVHHFVAIVGMFAVGVLTIAAVSGWTVLPQLSAATPLAWSTIVGLALLAAGSLWEGRAQHPFPVLYTLGLIAIAAFLGWRQLHSRNLIFAAAASWTGYVVLSGVAWTARRSVKETGLRLGMTPFALDGERVGPWLAPVSLAIGTLVIGVEFWVVLTFGEPARRIGGALVTLALCGGIALLATPRWREILQPGALVVGAVAAVQLGWSLMSPIGAHPHEELRRTIRMMAMLAATTFVYGLPLVRLAPRGSSWFASIRRVAAGVGATTVATLALVLLFEIFSFDPTAGTPVTMAESVLVAAMLVALAGGLVSLAVLPGRDPLLQSDNLRFLYVYAAEAVCGLLFAHLYLTNPQLFRHNLQPYWPLIVMGIAYGGTAVSELFRRLKVDVLARPLEHTAAFLPVLPVVGFWLLSSNLNYSTTLVVIGLLYLFLSLRRGSFVYGAAAAIVGNATLCSLFNEHGVSLLLHPQMFVIPPCLTILAAAQMNRDRLDASVLSALRYFAITTIYVSSTGEMFQNGIGRTLWLPMVLAGLSVLGVLAGIVLQVRAFLYLGTSFLLLSIVSMVWHAARRIDHVWPWWVFLFALGVGLLTLFGVFEKKRPEVLALVDRLRQWER